MKILSAFCSVGIGETLWPINDHDITGIEVVSKLAEEYKIRFPSNNSIIGDAYSYIPVMHDHHDIIFATPPCQSRSKLTTMNSRQHDKPGEDPRMFDLIEFLQENHTGPWIVENVVSHIIPRIPPKIKIGRHHIWSNIPLRNNLKVPKPWFRFDKGTYAQPGLSQTSTYLLDLQAYLGVKLSQRYYIRGNHDPGQIYREGLHPIIGKYLLNQLLNPPKTLLNYL